MRYITNIMDGDNYEALDEFEDAQDMCDVPVVDDDNDDLIEWWG